MPIDDLRQEVAIAAYKAIHSFDLKRNSGFATHLSWQIKDRLYAAAEKHLKHNGARGLSVPGKENDESAIARSIA